MFTDPDKKIVQQFINELQRRIKAKNERIEELEQELSECMERSPGVF
ncbi:MAG: hypothetical protein A4E25_00046 [Methanobacterium sp. PtaB.Bin024]|nr:MAG: hypothetical protein A4E25_00046 [Methanobacterium sp. PtaB.Bin024]